MMLIQLFSITFTVIKLGFFLENVIFAKSINKEVLPCDGCFYFSFKGISFYLPEKQKYINLNNRLSSDFLKSKVFTIDQKERGSFSLIKELLNSYDPYIIDLLMSLNVRRYKDEKKGSKTPLLNKWNNVSNIGFSHGLGLYQETNDFFQENTTFKKSRSSYMRNLSRLFFKALSLRLMNVIKRNSKYDILLKKTENQYPIMDKHQTYLYRRSKNVNVRSFILGHRPKMCHSIFEGSGIHGRIKKCLEKMLKKTRCKNSFNAICICDSIKYFNFLKMCLNGFSHSDIQTAYNHYRTLCKNPGVPLKECVNTYKSNQEIISCPRPQQDVGLRYDIEQCIEDATRSSVCKGLFDVLCLCDSISYKNALSKCVKNFFDLDKIFFLYRIICENPLQLAGCHKLSVNELTEVRECTSLFDFIIYDNNLRKCFDQLAFNSRCGNSYNIQCLCDSVSFMTLFYSCFQSIFDTQAQSIASSLKLICTKSYLFYKCANGNENAVQPRICYGFYKNFGLDNESEQCIDKTAKKAYCDNPYDLNCLCDSLIFVSGLQQCFSGNSETGVDKLRDFYENLCYNFEILHKCDKME
ncbi:hypothetical protein PCK1_001084 [Pneumocystis canis]|nr:hypothetical protein PCK1_001084 [Pneumocystis canis]